MAAIGIRLLGQPTVVVDGEIVPLTGRPLLLVLRLALSGDVPLSPSRLQQDLWPDGSGSDGAVRVTLTRVRKALGDGVVQRRQGGYTIDGADLDALRFERLVRAARDRSSPLDRRIAAYDAALSEWAGSVSEDLHGFPWLDGAVQRLDELREQAIDERFELLLLSGDHGREIADMRLALSRCPTRERRAELLAIALYRSGRQADALDVLSGVGADLRERLGLEPGPSLREVERQVLQHDRRLDAIQLPHRSANAVDVEGQLRAVSALLSAGVAPEARSILDDAERMATEAGDRRSIALVHLARARWSMVAGEPNAHEHIDRARQIGRELRDGDVLARAALVRLGAGVPIDKSAALIELLEPLGLLPPTAPEQVELLCAAAVMTSFIDGSSAAEQLVEQAQRLVDQHSSDRTRAVLLVARSLVTAVNGSDPERADAEAAEAYRLAVTTGDPMLVTMAAQGMLRSSYERGDLSGIDRVLERLDEAARAATVPFGAVRVNLCRATNAFARAELDLAPEHLERARVDGERMRTFAIEGAVRAQQVLLMIEADQRDVVLPAVRFVAAARDEPSTWDAVVALCGDDQVADALASLAPQVPVDGSLPLFAAVAAEVACRRSDAALGRWCADVLDRLGDRTVMVGLGTAVLGFARYFAGLAHAAMGDTDAAVQRLRWAAQRSREVGALLWWAHSTVELAEVLAGTGDHWEAKEQLNELAASGVAERSARIDRRASEVSAVLAR